MSVKDNKEELEILIKSFDECRLEEVTSFQENFKVKLDALREIDEAFETHFKKYINFYNKLICSIDRINSIKEYEKQMKEKYDVVVGIDEVGRGPLAGPVVACAAVACDDSFILTVDDSKKLSENVREEIFDTLVEHMKMYGLGEMDAKKIDEVNILNATFLAMKEAYDKLNIPSNKKVLVLIDGNKTNPYINDLNVTQECIIKGDSRSYSIACASIIAKVTRDREMINIARMYPQYDFATNKGYGTEKHLDALKRFGKIRGLHRETFLKKLGV